MNDLVKNSIEARKAAFYNAYNIKDEGIKNQIEELFKRIIEFGESCSDSMDFESKFATSPLNQEYIDLFTKVATACEPITYDTKPDHHIKSDAEQVADDIASELRYQVKDATLPARRIARQEAYDKARSTPIIGDIMHAKQLADFFGRFKKNKKEDKVDTDKEKDGKEKKEENK